MKLLICTQVVDSQHPVLGFFHRWIEEFAKYFEEVHVICLEEGEHSLPDNVKVYSLGKEDGRSRIKYVYRLYKYIWSLRKNYDHVFVHMNEEFAILGSPLWRLLGKRIGHWRMHGHVDWRLHISEKLVHTIFTGSKESFRLKSNKLNIVGHGIDVGNFVPQEVEKSIDLLTVGRITLSKNLEMLVDVLQLVRKEQDVSLTIVGKPIAQSEIDYEVQLKKYIEERGMSSHVHFVGVIPNAELPSYIAKSRVFVHAATNGSLDKAILEPLAMGVPFITTAEGANSVPLGDWHVSGAEEFAREVIKVLQSDTSNKSTELRKFVAEKHSLTSLIPKIIRRYQS